MNVTYSNEYKVSERVSLSRGTRFRAKGGPYHKSSKIAMSARGPFTFVRHAKKGALEWLEVLDRLGGFTILHVAGKRKSLDGFVARPYKVTSRVLGSLDSRRRSKKSKKGKK